MKPPICAYCYQDFRQGNVKGKLLKFALSEDEKEFNKKFKQPGFVGHPKGMAWFCEKHYPKAKSLTHLTLKEALKMMGD